MLPVPTTWRTMPNLLPMQYEYIYFMATSEWNKHILDFNVLSQSAYMEISSCPPLLDKNKINSLSLNFIPNWTTWFLFPPYEAPLMSDISCTIWFGNWTHETALHISSLHVGLLACLRDAFCGSKIYSPSSMVNNWVNFL